MIPASQPHPRLTQVALQGYLAHKKLHPTVGLCLGPYGGPREVELSYERGTPVLLSNANETGGLQAEHRKGGICRMCLRLMALCSNSWS